MSVTTETTFYPRIDEIINSIALINVKINQIKHTISNKKYQNVVKLYSSELNEKISQLEIQKNQLRRELISITNFKPTPDVFELDTNIETYIQQIKETIYEA